MSRIGDWLDERTGHRALLRHALDEAIPGGARWAYVWGSALTLCLVVQALTGVLLMTAYAPSATTAWASVHHITFVLPLGWLVRGLHHFGAQAMVVLLGAHLGQTALWGAYKRPREMNWYLGLGLLGTTLGFALTGYLLPWDQKGYWATRVATNIAGSIPLVGAFAQRLLVGGAEYGHLTLTRFYALHVAVLPAATFALLGAHVALFRKHGVTPAVSADRSRVDTFWPKQVGKDLAVGAVILAVLFALTLREHGAPLDAPADPSSDYPARPEWYFLPLFELLKHFEGSLEPVGAVGVPLLVGGYLVALPFLDGKAGATLRQRLRWLAPLGLVGLVGGALLVTTVRADAADASFQAARAQATERAARAVELAKRGVPPEGPLAMLAADPATRGPILFAAHCASCHRHGKLGPKGPATAPDLAGFGTKNWVLGLLRDPDAPNYFGGTPFKGQMPSLVNPPADPEAAKNFTPASAADLDAIADFLVLEAGGAGRGKGHPGEAIVKRRCTSCHRLDGKTDDEDSLAPELRGWASPAWTEAQIADPAAGGPYPPAASAPDLKGHMPAFRETLGERDRKVLTAWLVPAPAER